MASEEPDTKKARINGVDQNNCINTKINEIEELIKALEAAKKETEAAKKETEAAKKEIEAAKKETEAAKKETEAAKKEIEAAKKKTEILDKVSLRRLIVEKPELLLQCKGSKTSNIRSSNHRKAVSTQMPNCVVLEKIENTDVDLDRISNLLQTHTSYNGIYHSEADVSTYMGGALRDACSMAEDSTKITLCSYREFSLWSGRPDHLVVWNDVNSDPILVVEDKKPFHVPKKDNESGGETKIPGPVQGQMFDYIMELRCLGHSAPFAVLSDFQSSWLFWQTNSESVQLLETEDKVKLVLDCVGKTIPTPIKEAESNDDQGAEPKETPPAPKLVTESPTNVNISESIFSECDRTGHLNHSRRFESKDLVPLLYTAILCGLAQNPSALRKEQIIGRKNYDGIALKFTEKSYHWGHLNLKVGTPIGANVGSKGRKSIKQYKENTFVAIANIGRGSTSKVFEAYDSSGHLCAIKIYVKQCKDSNGKALTNEKSREEGKKACLKEIERLKQAYPFLKEKVSFQLVNNLPSIIMPYFQPLTDIERKDEKVKDEIRACLGKFYEIDTTTKLMYAEADLRWRHIGYYQDTDTKEKELVMFDLADLVEVEKNVEKGYIESQLNTLFARLSST